MQQESALIIRTAQEGGYCTEVEELPGCVSLGETRDKPLHNIAQAIEACLDTGSTRQQPISSTPGL